MLEEGGVFQDVGDNAGYLSVEVANLRSGDRVQVTGKKGVTRCR